MKRPLIGLLISATLFLLSIGLCGLGGINGRLNAQGLLVTAGWIALIASVLGGVVSLVWLLVALIRGR